VRGAPLWGRRACLVRRKGQRIGNAIVFSDSLGWCSLHKALYVKAGVQGGLKARGLHFIARLMPERPCCIKAPLYDTQNGSG
jgi:hypothetical protein